MSLITLALFGLATSTPKSDIFKNAASEVFKGVSPSRLTTSVADYPEFDAAQIANANRTLHLAYTAFCDEKTVTAWNCLWCNGTGANVTVTKYLYDWVAGTQGYVGYDTVGKRIVVGYRGSKNLANGLEDADIILTKFPGQTNTSVEVSQGFLTAYQSVKSDADLGIMKALSACPDCSLLFTGHSLGAAMATIGAVTYLTETSTDRKVDLYTFGCPRVGVKDFADYGIDLIRKSGGTNQRMARQDDIVPSVPYEWMGGFGQKYWHLPQEIWDRHDKGKPDWYVECSKTNGEDPNCYDSQWNLEPSEHTLYMGFKGGYC